MAYKGIKKIEDLSFEELADLVTALENMSTVADKPLMREQILNFVKKSNKRLQKE